MKKTRIGIEIPTEIYEALKKGDWEPHSEWFHSHREEIKEEFKRRREQREKEEREAWNHIIMEGFAEAENYKQIPNNVSGIYILSIIPERKRIGQAQNIRVRVRTHHRTFKIRSIHYYSCSFEDVGILEETLIDTFRPTLINKGDHGNSISRECYILKHERHKVYSESELSEINKCLSIIRRSKYFGSYLEARERYVSPTVRKYRELMKEKYKNIFEEVKRIN